ncbi:ribonuclease [Nocardioides daejeonensis]|uniref:ribonuclease n=1 Tax=Nocardioides daejeonensis TaxID=1046556 RepID=UPI001EF5CAB2|nr:ribonuclease [Nocardioides daejeonensis]
MTIDRRTLRVVGTALVAVVAVLLWWFQGAGDAPDDPGPGDRVAGSESSPSPAPSVTTTPSTGPRPTSSASTTPTAAQTLDIDVASGLRWVSVAELPPEAEETLELIDAGGPFPYDRDGVTFGNYEGILPREARGYYREYTVPTPGSRDRGARRIVTGADDEYYWTGDHYASFERIDW